MSFRIMQRRTDLFTGVVLLLAAVLLVAMLSGCDEDNVEKMLGSSTASSIERSYGVNHDPLLTDWLDSMGHTMVSFSTRQQIPYSFKLLETDMVNAFAGPWGHVYVTEGLLDFAESEEEVAGVVGHEIGHVVNRHIIKSFKQSMLFGIGTSVIGGESETAGAIAGIGLGLLSLRYSRKDEYEADDQGRLLSYRAGFNPVGELDFFQRLMEEKEHGSPSYIEVMVSTHPPTQRRIDRQNQKPELDPNNPDALVHIGQGYMRRAQYATALQYFQQAEALAPEEPHIQVAMADALAGCCGKQLAAEKYQTVLATRPDNHYARQQLTAVQARQPVVLAAIDSQESQAAQRYLQQVKPITLRISTAAIEAESFAKQLDGRVKPLAAFNSRVSNELRGLAGRYTELPDSIKDAVLEANAAIAQASEVVYALESVAPKVSVTASRSNVVAKQLRAKLEQLAVGRGRADELPVVKRSMREIEAALSDIKQTQWQAQQIAATAQQLRGLTEDNLRAITDLLACEEDEDYSLLRMDAYHLASTTRQQVQQALEACRRCRQPLRKAQLRTLIAQANLTGMAAPSTQRRALDELVAYHMKGEAADIEVLREQGLGYGEAAYVMAVSTSSRTAPPTQLLRNAHLSNSIVDELENFTDSNFGAKIMMKFCVHAMRNEVNTLEELEV